VSAIDAVDGSTGIAMCHIEVAVNERRESVVDAVDGSSTGIAMCQSCGVLENR
jgi:hypothetical protein